ncbi:hypothetical protein BsWGS_24986 [Bradybaena similaris]
MRIRDLYLVQTHFFTGELPQANTAQASFRNFSPNDPMAKTASTPPRNQYELATTEQSEKSSGNSGYRQHGDCTTSRVWLVLTIVFAVSTLALVVYLVYIKIFEQKEQSFEEKILLKYPGYFRTPEEQVVFEEQYNRLAVFNDSSTVTSGTTNDNCTFSCPIYRIRRSPSQTSARQPLMEMVKIYSTIHALSKRAVIQNNGNVYHACCISKHKFFVPDTAEDIDGNTVTVLKLMNQFQYFLTETCEHAADCTGCKCDLDTTLTSAVVSISDSNNEATITVKMIRVPGCCKCLNGALP